MAGAVNMKPVAVFVVVILGTSVAGIVGAIFAIPTAAAILAMTDYLRKRDVLLRAEDPDADGRGDLGDVPGPAPGSAASDATPAPEPGQRRADSAPSSGRRREQVAELLAPDDRAREAARVGARRQVVAEGPSVALSLPELERTLRVALRGRRQVDVQVGPIADREVLEAQVIPAWLASR